jgi:hypothetical protein
MRFLIEEVVGQEYMKTGPKSERRERGWVGTCGCCFLGFMVVGKAEEGKSRLLLKNNISNLLTFSNRIARRQINFLLLNKLNAASVPTKTVDVQVGPDSRPHHLSTPTKPLSRPR